MCSAVMTRMTGQIVRMALRHVLKGGEVHHARRHGGEVTADHGDEQGDDGEEAPEEDGAKHGYPQGDGKDQNVPRLHGGTEHQPALRIHGHEVRADGAALYGVGGQLQADEGHHRPHGRGRQDDVDPVGAELPHHQGQQAAQQPRDHKAALGVFKAQLRDDDARGR